MAGETSKAAAPKTPGGATLEQVREAVTSGNTGPVMPSPDRFKLTPSQHLFSQLVIGIVNGQISAGFSVDRLSKDTARNIVKAAKNLAEAIEEVA